MQTKLASSHKDWYSRIPEADRRQVDALAKWLNPVPWQLFVTLTFPWNVASETADRKLRELLNTVEKELRNRICFVAGKERKPHSAGMEVPWHFHLLMTARCQIPTTLIKDCWRKLVGSGRNPLGQPTPGGDSVDVQLFNEEKRGAEYCLKLINDCHGDWNFRWLEIFNPNIPLSESMSHRKLRQQARSKLR